MIAACPPSPHAVGDRGWSRCCAVVGLALVALAAPVRGDLLIEDVRGISGLAPGQALGAWCRLDPAGEVLAEGPVDAPFAFRTVLLDQVPRGSVELLRRGEWIPVPVHGFRLRVEPRLPEARLTTYREAVARVEAEAEARRAGGLAALEELARTTARPSTRAWILLRLAQAHREGGDLEAAAEELGAAAELDELAPRTSALLLEERASVLYDLRRPEGGSAAAHRALELLESAGAETPVLTARLRSDLGLHLLVLGRHDEAERLLTRALETLGRLAPDSYQEAAAWSRAGIIASLRGDYALGERRHERALEILRGVGANPAKTLSNLGILARQRGDLERAEELYLRALEESGDPEARASYRLNLGNVYRARGELDRAHDLFTELATFYREERPEAVFARGVTLTNLAETERQLGRLDDAEEHAREALALKQKRAPHSLGTVNALNALGRILQLRHRWSAARDLHAEALRIAEKVSPSGPLTAEAHAELGKIDLAEGMLDAAESRYRRALELQRALAPGTEYEARWTHALGRIEARRGRPDAALHRYLEAVDVLESLRGRLGGGAEAGAGFTSLHHELYWRPLDLLASLDRSAEAFRLLERFRAQELLAMLARRDLDLSADLEPELDRERRRLAARYDAALQRLWWATGEPDGEARRALREELDRIRRRQKEVEDRILAASTRLGRLRNPEPLDAVATRAMLPRETLLLSYALGPERSWVFALGPGLEEVEAVELSDGLEDVRRRVATHRALVARPHGRARALRTAGASLTRTLLAPVAGHLRSADHLLVIPDGPLHLLPWAALPEPGRPGERLLERRAISVGASATVLSELLHRESTAPVELVAFGASAEGSEDSLSAPLPRTLRSDLAGAPLRGAVREVATLAELFGDEAEILLGGRVTQERLLATAPEARRVHVASHAVVDPRFPLESGLVLAPAEDGQSNGFLQVWEIYQRLRLNADLVTLSACETALGKELAGEGVLGLTRAFHYAGARTVVSSLWEVSDRASALLMERFYRNLLAGRGKAEALRQAQLDLMHGDDEPTAGRAHPFYWAAFQVHGAWD